MGLNFSKKLGLAKTIKIYRKIEWENGNFAWPKTCTDVQIRSRYEIRNGTERAVWSKTKKNILSKNKTNDFETLFPRYVETGKNPRPWLVNQWEGEVQERVTFVTLIYVLLSPKSSLAVLNLMKNPIFFYVEIYRGSHISEVMSERFVRIVRNRRIDFLQCKKICTAAMLVDFPFSDRHFCYVIIPWLLRNSCYLIVSM